MLKKTLLVFLLFLSSLNFAAASTKKVLILYDEGEDRRVPSLTDARYLSNLLGHFDTSVRTLSLKEYKKGEMENYSLIFYINYEKNFILPQDFKSDFYSTKKEFCWLNLHLGQLDQGFLKKQYGFHFTRYSEDLKYYKVIYNGAEFPKGDENLNIVQIDDPAKAQVISFTENESKEKSPYIVKSKNLWFIADSPFSYYSENDRYILFAELLHDIAGENHPVSHTALIRIEDVSPVTEPKQLLKIAKFLKSKDVPFSVSVVPVYIDTLNKIELHYEDKPELLKVLQKIPALGGTFVMHGYTHQYHGLTADDYEFWDDAADKPIRGDSVLNTSSRIEKGLKELFSNNIYPFAWETPHYFASKNTYNAVKKYFSISYERRGTRDFLGTDQFFPYQIKDIYQQNVIPENLGYIQIDKPDVAPLLSAAKLNLTVRDGFASFFFHPFIDVSYLRQLIKGLKNMGYEFKDIKSFYPKVTAKDKALISQDTKISIETPDKYIQIREFDNKGKTKTSSVYENTTGKKFVTEVHCPQGNYAVIETRKELEAGFLKKIWRMAKVDLRYLREKEKLKNSRSINRIMDFAFINPSSPSLNREEENDLKALKFSLSITGIKFKEFTPNDLASADLREYDVIVVPLAAAKTLKNDEIKLIKEAVGSGSNIVFDGVSRLNDEFEIELQQEPISVKEIRDFHFPEIPLYWPGVTQVRPVYNASNKDYKILCVEDDTNLPITVSGKYGKGSFVYLSALFDPYTQKGYTRFPFLLEMLDTAFEYSPPAERKIAEMYFDPGMRQVISIEKLAKMWRKYGVNKIYAGGWHFYDKYTYDYERMIKVCHENGILVYCWLEPPMVNQKFWNKHPEWREKTAMGKDAKIGWRYLMNLADDKCRKTVFEEMESLFSKYDWDGVNIAELYFDSPSGPARPDNFTPMNDVVRKDFQKRNGFDPVLIFKPESQYFWQTNPEAWKKVSRYRKDLCNKLKIDFIEFFTKVKAKKSGFEIMITAIDTLMSPEYEDNIAEDMEKLIWMENKYAVTLQIEDPSILWSGKPERYFTLGEHYKKFVTKKSRLVLDCNVLDNHKKGDGGLPAEKPIGEEMRQIAYNMDAAGARPAFYSEETVYETDYKNINAVFARDVTVRADGDMQWIINSPFTATIKTGKKNLMVWLNDEQWYAGEGEYVIVPQGESILKFEQEQKYFDLSSLKPRLNYISCELKWANFYNNQIEFLYESDDAPAFVILSKRPSKIFIDDKKTECKTLKSENNFSVKLPSGSHKAKIIVGGGFSSLLESSGVVLLSLIVVFGFFTSIVFLGLFITIQIKRKLKL